MANTYLKKNIGSPNQQKFTWSVWVKRSKIGVEHHLAGNFVDGNNRTHLFFHGGNNTLRFYSELSGSQVIMYETNRKFKDVNAWYHIMCAVDTTQGGGNRIKFYINGVRETSLLQTTECNQNTNLSIGGNHYIGTYGGAAGNGSYSLEGCMSHVHFIDGTAYDSSSFGSIDSVTGHWQINTTPSVTYGSSGYFILKDGNSTADVSPNNNTFTISGGTLTKTEDSPSNNWVTFNSVSNNSSVTFVNGNTTVSSASTSWKRAIAGLGNNSGKWYWEVKRASSGTPYIKAGMIEELGQTANMPSHEHHADNAYGWAWYVNGGTLELRTNQAVISGFSQSDLGNTTIANGDIICVALDLDNGRLHARKNNGSWFKSGNPTAGSGGYSIANFSANTKFYFPACSVYATTTAQHNFGNGFFGTTAVSSAGTNASGFGIFEFDVPAGFTALTTKGLNL